MPSVLQQAFIVVQKNFLIYFQQKQFIAEIAVPIVVFIMLMIGQHQTSPIFLEVVSEFVPMTLIATSRYIVIQMIAEKSERQKEVQKIMGLKGASYQLGWFLFNLSRLLIVCFLFLVLTVPTGCFNSPLGKSENFLNSSQLIGSFILFGLSQCSQQYFITSLFDQPRSGADFSIIISVIGSFCAQLLDVQKIYQNEGLLTMLGFIFPTFGFDIYVFPQLGGIPNTSATSPALSVSAYFALQGCTALIYALLFSYLEQVLPNEYGTNKHPLFFLGCKYQQPNEDVIETSYELNNIDKPFINQRNSEFQEDSSSAIYHEVFENTKQVKRAIQIKKVRKTYGELKAVDGVSLQIYDSQILCLLGHNGAGKTTLISLLTGLIKKDGGLITYYNTDTDFDDIRNYLGICPQRDVLYESMNSDQHLWYYGKIKGLEEKQLIQEIDAIINKCDLMNDRNKPSKDLSGGTKRKLSLAISLIGNSKVIFLDEPTSGMDPISRKKIWEILLQVKNEGRCLLLTTHHLDEAEVLSERIAIMAKGKLLTVGSVDFVKANFGIGYYLNISNKETANWEVKQKQIIDLTKQYIPSCQINTQTQQDCLSFQIAFDKKEQLLPLFQQLEKDTSIQINLIMNTLEEAFINIGMDEESFLKKKTQGDQVNQETNQTNLQEEFNKIIPPQCLSQPPQFSFWLQLLSCLLKKQYNITYKRLIIGIVMPAIFIVLGPYLSTIYYKNFVNINRKKYENEFYENALAIFDSYGYIVLGFVIASSQLGSQPVEEREKKQKYALNVMGLKSLPFWLGYFIYDLITCVILLIVFIIAVNVCGFDKISTSVFYGLFFAFSFAFLPFLYLLSWIFTSYNTAIKSMLVIQLFVSYLIAIGLYILCIDNLGMMWFLSVLLPTLSFFSGCVTFLDSLQLKNQHHQPGVVSEAISGTSPDYFILLLIVQGLVYFGLTIIIDNRTLLAANASGNCYQSQDQDVMNEQARVLDLRCKDRVIARQISKTYSNGFQAVKGTSFGIEPGQIFGLLGPNGAGKSTTFNMITSKLRPSSGSILLEQNEILKGLGDIYLHVGICPQFDSLYDIVSVRNHLQLWGLMKGLIGKDLEESIQYFLQVMQLEAYENKEAGQLSGGNKRKLCVALALMGGTNMQFFDEPSSGVDPIARRFLWNAIQQGVKLRQSSVILTTHTMDEAESLCNKIAIQVNGQFACIGSVQHLKQKFGDGYRIIIDPQNKDCVEQILNEITKTYGQLETIIDEYGGKIICKIPISGFQFYQAFYFFQEKLQKQLKLIKDFQISQPNLEQIFVQFAAQQVAEQEKAQIQSNNWYQVAICCGNDEDN